MAVSYTHLDVYKRQFEESSVDFCYFRLSKVAIDDSIGVVYSVSTVEQADPV